MVGMIPLNTELKQRLLAPFEASEVRIRTQPYTASYITARVAMTRLDETLWGQWEFRLTGPGIIDENGIMHQDGCLIIHQPDGPSLQFHNRGSAPKDIGKGQAKQAKHAVSDCFKRCAVSLGIARYFYELQGVQGDRLPKGSVEKALAAVGWHGKIEDKHHGRIGGIREGDAEDEDVSGHVASEPEETPKTPAAKPKAQEPTTKPAPTPTPAPTTNPAPKASSVQIKEMAEAVSSGGGNAHAATFLGWLAKNTSNGAEALGEVLAQEVSFVIAKLHALAEKRNGSPAAKPVEPEPAPEEGPADAPAPAVGTISTAPKVTKKSLESLGQDIRAAGLDTAASNKWMADLFGRQKFRELTDPEAVLFGAMLRRFDSLALACEWGVAHFDAERPYQWDEESVVMAASLIAGELSEGSP